MPEKIKPAAAAAGTPARRRQAPPASLPIQYRAMALTRDALDKEKRTIRLSFSSETPVEQWWGTEILGHGAGEVDLTRLNNGAPALFNHKVDDYRGVIESPSIENMRGMATVRFGSSPQAEQLMQDVADGIIRGVSVGYRILDLEPVDDPDGDDDAYRATRWAPYEISFCTIPADLSVGVGRSAPGREEFPVNVHQRQQQEATLTTADTTIAGGASGARSADALGNTTGLTPMVAVAAAGDRGAAIDPIVEERARMRDISAIGEKFNCRDFAGEHIQKGTSRELFYGLVLQRLGEAASDVTTRQAALGMSQREVKEYRLVRALAGMAIGGKQAKAGLEFEREISDTLAQRMNRPPEGLYVPMDVQISRDDPVTAAVRAEMARRNGNRAMTVGTNAQGGFTVETSVMGQNFIELLRNRMMVRQLGAWVLSGLVGNIAIPKQTAGGTMTWQPENTAGATTNQTLAQVALSPKSATAWTDISRLLLLQSSIDVEAFVRSDLMQIVALGIDLASLHGTGAGNQPTGIINQSGIASIVCGNPDGGPLTWGNIVDFETQVAINNADVGSLGYLTNAKVRGKLKNTAKIGSTFPAFIWDDGRADFGPGFGMLNGYKAGVTNQVSSTLTKGASAGILSAMFFGNWSDLIIAEWGTLDVMVDPYSNSTTGAVRVVVFQTVDIGVRHATSFAVASDVNPA